MTELLLPVLLESVFWIALIVIVCIFTIKVSVNIDNHKLKERQDAIISLSNSLNKHFKQLDELKLKLDNYDKECKENSTKN